MSTNSVNKVTNDSGTGYCKFPDGTLIQWGHMTFGAVASNSTVNATYTYAIPFVADPVVSATVSHNTTLPRALNVISRPPTDPKTSIRLYYGNSHTAEITTPAADWIAIGRWK